MDNEMKTVWCFFKMTHEDLETHTDLVSVHATKEGAVKRMNLFVEDDKEKFPKMKWTQVGDAEWNFGDYGEGYKVYAMDVQS